MSNDFAAFSRGLYPSYLAPELFSEKSRETGIARAERKFRKLLKQEEGN